MTCPDTITYDWFTATLKDNTTGTTTTPRSKVCATNSAYVQVSVTVTAGHSYTLTLTNHDDNYPADPSYTYIDDVTTS
jgi:serine protease